MTPYYDQDGITIYHGDCREILPSLGKFDLLLTDPPYGIDFKGKKTRHKKTKSGGYATVEDCPLIGPYVVRLALPLVSRAAVFPGKSNLWSYPASSDIGCIYCPAGVGIGKWGFTCFHPILFYGQRPSSVLRPTSMDAFGPSENNGHPCPKPLKWIIWLLKLAALPADTVIDPFSGSGTTLDAAKLLGHKAIGIEINEDYCKITVERLRQGVLIPC
jgi:site-specific DNA-methyltransferase (adenine-specific)